MDTKGLEQNIKTIIKTGSGYGAEFLPVLRETKNILKRINKGRPTAENYFQLGTLCLKLEDSKFAFEAFLTGFQLNNNHVDCGLYAALLLEQHDKMHEAIVLYKQLNLIDPDNIHIVDRMLFIFYQQSKLKEVLEICFYFLNKKLYYSSIYTYLSQIYLDCGNLEKALEHIQNAIDLDKNNVNYISKKITLLYKAKNFQSVIDYKELITEHESISFEIKVLLANSYAETDRLQESRDYFVRLLRQEDNRFEILSEIGLLHMKYETNVIKGRFIFNYILKRDEQNIFALTNLALISRDAETKKLYEKVLEIKPDHPLCRMNYGHKLLADGDLEEGFEYYESRVELSLPALSGRLNYPDSLNNKNIFIWNEQGIGDQYTWSGSFQFLEKEQVKAKVQIDYRLLPIMKRSFPSLSFTAEKTVDLSYKEDFTQYDAEMINVSVSKYFISKIRKAQEQLETNNIIKPHLFADEEKKQYWLNLIASKSDLPSVGICWRSGMLGGLRDYGYLQVEDIITIFKEINCNIINLQYSYTEEELQLLQKGLGNKFINFKEINLKDDQDELAALISSLDMVFSVTTAVLSLSGALGVRTISPINLVFLGKPYNIFAPSAKSVSIDDDNGIGFHLDHYKLKLNQELESIKMRKNSQKDVTND